MSAVDDLRRIEAVLFALWAPIDGDPTVVPPVLDDALTINDVIRARRALVRLELRINGRGA